MLRDENVAGYRKLIRETLEFDPEILKRYVNFMTNPDETALEQFGKGDKYFGAATVSRRCPACRCSATARSRGSARSTAWSSAARRSTSSRTAGWWSDTSARSSRCSIGGTGSPRRTTSSCTTSTPTAVRSMRTSWPTRTATARPARSWSSTTASPRRPARSASRRRTRASRRAGPSAWSAGRSPRAWACPTTSMFVTFRDARTGLAYLRSCRDVRERGLWLALDAYQGHVFWEFRELADGVAGQWRRLAERLGGRGVASLDEALRDAAGAGPRAARALFDDGHIAAVLDGTATDADLDVLEAVGGRAGGGGDGDRVSGDPVLTAARIRDEASAAYRDGAGGLSRGDRAAACSAGWSCRASASSPGRRRGTDEPGVVRRAAPGPGRGIRVPVGRHRRRGRLGRGRPRPGAARCRAVHHPRSRAAGRPAPPRGLAHARPDPCGDGLNTWEGVEWLDRERFANLLRWAVRLDAIETGRDPDTKVVDRLAKAPRRPVTGSMRCWAPQPAGASAAGAARRRWSAVSDDRLEVLSIAEARGLAEPPGRAPRTDYRRIGACGGPRAGVPRARCPISIDPAK